MVYKFKQRFRKHKGYFTNFQSGTPCYEYDAMISYSPKELSFVLTDVIPRLENEAGFKLYVKDRDEPVGTPFGETIMEAIQIAEELYVL